MKGGRTGIGTDEDTLTDVLCLHRHRLDKLQQRYLEITERRGAPESLETAIIGEPSGKYQQLLLSLIATAKP